MFSRTVWLQGTENLSRNGLNTRAWFFLLSSLKGYSCCHCLSGSTVSVRTTLGLSLLTCSLPPVCKMAMQLQASHVRDAKTVRKTGPSRLGLSFLKIKAKAFLEALGQIPTHTSVAGTRLYNDPSAKGGWQVADYSASVLRGRKGREFAMAFEQLLGCRHSARCSSNQGLFLHT